LKKVGVIAYARRCTCRHRHGSDFHGSEVRSYKFHRVRQKQQHTLFLVQSATIVSANTHQIALVVVSWLGPEEETLCGSAVVRNEPREAMVHATLDAINRTVLALGAR
jgi:hypothetical protein